MSVKYQLITLEDDHGAMAVVAPELGGWLLRYARRIEGPESDWVEALHFSQEVLERYPREMYAGIPLLFPLVGNNRAEGREHHYAWNGALHEMPQHGFARRQPWRITAQERTSITMRLSAHDGLRPSFPFDFLATVEYSLRDGALASVFTVVNQGTDPMPFGFGWHPYFQVPLGVQGRREDCFVELPESKRVLPQGKWERFSTKPFPSQNWSVDEDVSGTLFLTDLKKNEAVLVDPNSGREVVMTFNQEPKHRFIALWAKSTDAPYYCVEPWTALPNAFGRTHDRDLITLPPGNQFRTEFAIELR